MENDQTPPGDQAFPPVDGSAVEDPHSADTAAANAPDPSPKGRRMVTLAGGQTTTFVVEGIPVITQDGVQLTVEQAKKVEEMAEVCGVSVTNEEVEK